MDFNAIYEAISPYLGTSTIAIGIITIFALAIKFAGTIKDIKKTFSSTESEALKVFKSALPKELYVNIQSLAQSEFAKMVDELKKVVDERFLSQIQANTEIVNAIANAMLSMKSIPDSSKKTIARLLAEESANTTEALKVELLSVPEVSVAASNETKILID